MTNINETVEMVKQATDFQTNRKILREKIRTDLVLPYNGGLFLVTPELQAFLATHPDDVIYLEDSYENPVQVNRIELLELCRERYQRVMNTWHQQYEQLRKIRKI